VIVAYSYVPVIEEAAGDAFALAMSHRSRSVETFPGFRRFEFRRELGKKGRFVIATWWDSREDLKRYMSSPEHKATHSQLTKQQREGLGKPEVVIHDVMEVASA